jgi:hypothetical protein
MHPWLMRARRWTLVLATGGSVLVLGSCDPTARTTVLQGVGAAATNLVTALIQAGIDSWINQGQADQTTGNSTTNPTGTSTNTTTGQQTTT